MLFNTEYKPLIQSGSLLCTKPTMCKILCEMGGVNSSMLMNISVWKLEKGTVITCDDNKNETAMLLVSGKVKMTFENREEVFDRPSPFGYLPGCLHTCKGVAFSVLALEASEIIIQQTNNDNIFDTEVYGPQDCDIAEFGKGQWNGTGHRKVLTVFDLSNAPKSNLVIGEVFNQPGRWSSYPPHHHPQPEVYYYHFDKPQGFGACFNGNDVFKSTDGSFCTVEGGNSHQQVTAPGYEMYYCWMIRHIDGDPWNKTRITDKEHEWLLDQ